MLIFHLRSADYDGDFVLKMTKNIAITKHDNMNWRILLVINLELRVFSTIFAAIKPSISYLPSDAIL